MLPFSNKLQMDDWKEDLECILGLDKREEEEMKTLRSTQGESGPTAKRGNDEVMKDVSGTEIESEKSKKSKTVECEKENHKEEGKSELELKIESLERERIRQVDEVNKLQNDLALARGLKAPMAARIGLLPFGFDRDKFLTRDLRSAAMYIATIIAPMARNVVSTNQSKFKLTHQMAAVCENSTIRTCTNFNQGMKCVEGDCHFSNGYLRTHCCMLCWEGLWLLAPHKVICCPLLTHAFWLDVGIDL